MNYCGMPSIAKLRGVMVGVFRPGMPAVCAAQWMVEEPRIMLGCSVTTRPQRQLSAASIRQVTDTQKENWLRFANTQSMSVLSCSSSAYKACGLIAAGGCTSLVPVELE